MKIAVILKCEHFIPSLLKQLTCVKRNWNLSHYALSQWVKV